MLLLRRLVGGSPDQYHRPLVKGDKVIAARTVGDFEQGYVCQGTTGFVSAVSRVQTYEVTFDGSVRLINLTAADLRPY